jgi:hypothetical protein
MIEKKKKFGSRMGAIPFTLWWTLAYALGWGTLITGGIIASNLFWQIFEWFPLWVYFGLLGLVPGFISSIGQQFLIKRKFDVSIPRWWLWSTLVWTIAGTVLRLMEYWPSQWAIDNEQIAASLILSALFVPPAIVQAWLLRKHISRSWMWPVAAVVSSTTFVLPILASSMSNEFEAVVTFGIAGLMQGAVMGLSLLWLFGMASGEKTKKAYAEQEQIEHSRHRLEDTGKEVEAEPIMDRDIVSEDQSMA